MVAATLLEKGYGTDFAVRYIYGSPLFVACWAVMTACSIAYLVCRKVQKRLVTFLLHLSFVVILLGALVTHLFGLQGNVHLRGDVDIPVQAFVSSDGTVKKFPFALSLKEFRLEYYPGTAAPMDFISRLSVKDGEAETEAVVSMNHIYTYRHYRFYQSGYDADRKGTTLSVAYDPWGIGITYTGYGLLLCSLLLFFFERGSEFRKLLRHPLLKGTAVGVVLLFGLAQGVQAKGGTSVLPPETAAKFGELYVYYNDRVCPLQTLAKDFTVKLCGKSSYNGLTSEQVLTGWLFFYDKWKKEPCIRIKNKEVRRLLGIEGAYASLSDFVGKEGYKLDNALQEDLEMGDKRAIEEANEKFSLISMAAAGSLWKLYPYAAAPDSLAESGKLQIVWYSLADRLPYDMPDEQWGFVRNCMNYVAEKVVKKDYKEVESLLEKIRKYQVREAEDNLPSDARFKAEQWYNAVNNSRPLAMASVTLGILSFVFYCLSMVKRKEVPAAVSAVLFAMLGALFLYLCFTITLRGIAGGHFPVSNGHETMQVMAACVALLTIIFYRKMPVVIAFGFLLCGLALLVSMLGEANPQITQLMPVLSSPLLSFHVVIIMIAYSLLAFVMLNGLTAMVLYGFRKDSAAEVERLQVISRIILYPAVFCLAVGIFIGAVWANVSWGRYWGWDPKEVWALITMLIYALALHPASLPWFRKPLFFHLFSIAAFFSVLITYFGVNFLLGGMHSYA